MYYYCYSDLFFLFDKVVWFSTSLLSMAVLVLVIAVVCGCLIFFIIWTSCSCPVSVVVIYTIVAARV